MLHPSTKKLIDRLAEMTELGKLDWTEGENGSLIYSTEGYSVCLPEGAQEVIIQSIDGKELERAATDALASTMSDDGKSYAQIVSEMGAEADRYARGTETAISSLLAGMEEPEAAAEEDVTPGAPPADDGPEDPGDESAALASEGIANHELTPATDAPSTPDTDDTEADEDESTAEDTSFAPEANAMSESADADESEAVAEDAAPAPEAAPDSDEDAGDIEASAAVEDDVDTESDVTEAVARLADEVNNRPEAAPSETMHVEETEVESSEAAEADLTAAEEPRSEDDAPSSIGLAAATAMGVVASAAGLDDDSSEAPETADASAESETSDEATTEPTEPVQDEALTAETIIAAAPAHSYVPFGLEAADETPVSTIATAPVAEPEVANTAPVETPSTTFGAHAPQIEQVDSADAADAELDETIAPDSSLAFGAETDEQAVETTFDATVEDGGNQPEAASFVTSEDTTADAAPDAETAAADDTVDAASTEPEPEAASVVEAPVTMAPPVEECSPEPETVNVGGVETETETEIESEPEAETEPVLAAPNTSEAFEAPAPSPEPPKTYSLSGIGAGFGLGALSAKTEASGIPGPTSVPQPAPEKIVIDATEDVLPEIEGNLNLEKMEAAVSEINFGNKAASDSEKDSDAEDDADGDILKPRTRFNPWD